MAVVEAPTAGTIVSDFGEHAENSFTEKGNSLADAFVSTSTGDSSTDDAFSSEQETDDDPDFGDTLARLSSNSDSDAGDLESAAVKELRGVHENAAAIAQKLEAVGKPDLVAALSSVMAHLASLGCKPHRATVFHSARPPPISIRDYMTRIATYYHCSDGCLVLGLIYIDRLVKTHPEFVVSALNIHRLIAVSVMLGAKFHDDVFYSNAFYGKVAGLQTKELNKLEERFLTMLQWRLSVHPGEYEEYLRRVLLSVGPVGQ